MHRIEEVFVTDHKMKSPAAKRKIPLIRRAGEIVFPKHMKSLGKIKISPAPAIVKKRLEPSPEKVMFEDVEITEDIENMENVEDSSQIASDSVNIEFLSEQLNRVEKKLDDVLTKLSQHDGTLKLLKHNVKDLRIEFKNSCKQQAQSSTLVDEKHFSPKRSRKRLILFPVIDDHYLARLEELVQADEEMRQELFDLYNEAPNTSVYEYLRKNTYCLFENTSKFTWTGKPATGPFPGPPSNPAYKLQLVEMLLVCCGEKFPNSTRSFIEKEFRHALQNFNDAKWMRAKRRQQNAEKTTYNVSIPDQEIV
ncbi:uncharacterized protein LOC131432697 [Malaya genurostris]|uniref:uncharacterized protein LOC131432697 n=1 Tax=Malaya genurostris TaxID=325434 RepID=UPI0026F39C69|nr:uncharacterized protein LOC131432697 [Malaya genurostris]